MKGGQSFFVSVLDELSGHGRVKVVGTTGQGLEEEEEYSFSGPVPGVERERDAFSADSVRKEGDASIVAVLETVNGICPRHEDGRMWFSSLEYP